VEADLAARRAGAQRGLVFEVARRRLGAARADLVRRGLGAGQRADVPALGAETLYESAPDEARPAGYERARQRFGMPSPQSVPEQGLCATSATFALPLLSRVRRKLVQAVLFVVVVSRKFPSGLDVESR
jgi:hypothetical protein